MVQLLFLVEKISGGLLRGWRRILLATGVDRPEMAGAAVHDPVGALLLASPYTVDLSVINGRVVVEDGELLGVDMEELVSRHNELAHEMASRHPYEA